MKQKTSNQEKGGALFRGAIILSLGGIFTKIIGAVYRIPLTNILGAEGIGIYQLVFPLYILLLTISSTGVPSAISRLISEEQDEKAAKNIFKVALWSLIILGGLLTIVLILLAPLIAKMQGNILVKKSYYAIAPSVFFVAGISVYRGYFQGKLKMAPTALSQIIEQVFKAGFAIMFSILFMPDVLKAVFFTVLSVSISELIALIFLMGYYNFTYRKKGKLLKSNQAGKEDNVKIEEDVFSNANFTQKNSFKIKPVLKSIFKISIPVTIAALLLPLSQLIDSVFVVNFLNAQNLNGTLLYGLLTGPVFSIISLPVVIASSIAAVALPLISRARIKNDYEGLNKKIAYSLKFTFLVSIPCALMMFLYSYEISKFLYGGLGFENISILSNLLKICSLSVIFLSLMQVTVSILVALKKVYVAIITLSLAIIFKIILNIILLPIPFLNIYGAAISSMVCYFIAAILNFIFIIANTKHKFNSRRLTRR